MAHFFPFIFHKNDVVISCQVLFFLFGIGPVLVKTEHTILPRTFNFKFMLACASADGQGRGLQLGQAKKVLRKHTLSEEVKRK